MPNAREYRGIAAAQDLLDLGVAANPAFGSPTEVSSLIVAALFTRASSTMQALVWLSAGRFASQGDMLNRILFEDMASAHWVTKNRDLALERLQQS